MAVLAVSVLAGCGGDDSDVASDDPSVVKEDDDSEGVACGAESCVAPPEFEGAEVCCIDPFSGGGCGLKVSGTCRPIPKNDDRCPAPMLDIMGPPGTAEMGVTGCCTADNVCGVDFGIGCQPRETACNVVRPDQVDLIMPMTCDGEERPLPEGCGMNTFRPGGPPPPAAGSGG